ncbi:MAG TPA: hypothetical protein VLD57_08275 [Blastocatellia bacterium]|nr:hypothetical protein [Blastocatellia bacterium]
MRVSLSTLMRAAGVCALVIICAAGVSAQPPGQSQEQKKSDPKEQKISEGENQAIKKISEAVDVAAKLQAGNEFIQKYPKSVKRAEVARHIAGEITNMQDAAQQITLAESFATSFNQPDELALIHPHLMDAYIKSNRIDDAFRVAAVALGNNSNDVVILTQMALVGAEELKKNNPKYLQQSQTYAVKAIELIEADKMPATMDAARWGEYKSRWLPHLYQSLGLISFLTGNKADAKAKLNKAASLNANDPVTFMLLGSMVNEEYQQLAEKHKTMSAGPLKEDTLKEAHAKLDLVIEAFARAVALSEGNPQYQRLHDQLLQDLQVYYKYRKGTTDGLQQLIDKYKKP